MRRYMRSQAVSYIYGMVSSRIFLSALFSWFLAQIIKVAVETIRGEHRGSRDVLNTLVWRTGGMPSSHASLVTGIATSIGSVQAFSVRQTDRRCSSGAVGNSPPATSSRPTVVPPNSSRPQ